MRAWTVLLFLVTVLFGCVSPAQRTVAEELYFLALDTTTRILKLETNLADAVSAMDWVAIHKDLSVMDDLKRTWKRQSDGATGKVAAAASEYEAALNSWVKMFEAAEKAARFRDSSESRLMVNYQMEAHDLWDAASNKLEKLK